MKRSSRDRDGSARKSRSNMVLVTPEILEQINPVNKALLEDFISYLDLKGRAKGTLITYRSNINIFFAWNLKCNKNKKFTNITRNEFLRFEMYCKSMLKWADRRILIVHKTLSSFCEYLIETEEFYGFKNLLKMLPYPRDIPTLEPTVYEKKDIDKLLNALVKRKKYMYACAVALAASSGRTISEMVQFKINWFTDENVVCGCLYYTPEKIKIAHTINDKYEQVYVYKPTFDKYLNLWIQQRNELGVKSPWLFPSRMPSKYGRNNKYTSKPARDGMLAGVGNYVNKNININSKYFYWTSVCDYFKRFLIEQKVPDEVIVEMTKWTPAQLKASRKGRDALEKFFNDINLEAMEDEDI